MEKIKLTFPVTIDGTEYSELTMRRSKVKDRLAVSSMQASDEQKEIRLLANLCNVPPQVLEEMDETDYARLQKVYVGFFGSVATFGAK